MRKFLNQTLPQLWCSLKGHEHPIYSTVYDIGTEYPVVIVKSFCSKCKKHLHDCIGVDWGHPSFNKQASHE